MAEVTMRSGKEVMVKFTAQELGQLNVDLGAEDLTNNDIGRQMTKMLADYRSIAQMMIARNGHVGVMREVIMSMRLYLMQGEKAVAAVPGLFNDKVKDIYRNAEADLEREVHEAHTARRPE